MRKRFLVAAAVVIVGAVVAARALRLPDLMHIGAGYTAEQTCACLFVSHRTLDSCRGELEPMARWFVAITPGADSVTARSFVLSRATARFQKNFGCSLEN
ncbi:MAG TPA: hypothetical protein VMU50_06205 [Polyangia bacterium]|nr:hypothetical protein [Polyangia bacterium]